MKTSIKLIFLFFLISITGVDSFSQVECFTIDPVPTSQLGTPNVCWSNSVSSNTYDPDYVPTMSDPIKTIKVTLNIMQKSDGTGNFSSSNPQDMAYINGFENSLNSLLQNMQLPMYGGVQGPAQITDSRIRVEFVAINFYPDDLGYSNDGSVFGEYAYDNYASNTCSTLNLFLAGRPEPDYESVAGKGEGLLGPNTNYLLMWNLYADYIANPPGGPNPLGGTPWITNPLTVHEIGHCLGLRHSFSSCSQFPDMDCPQSSGWCNPATDNQCSNNVMSYSSTKRNFTPRQLGHMHELLNSGWRKGMVRTCSQNNQNDIAINTDETWTHARLPGGDITITTGNTLTIECLVSMPTGSKIIIEPGATCIIDGGTVTNQCCDEMWHGIEVAGDTDEHQYSFSGGNYHQGRLIMRNGAVIENAVNGARNMLGNDWGARGGIIQATNSTFLNCRRAVEFMSYQNFSPSNPSIDRPDQSFFRECLFELNDDYLYDQDQATPAARITLWQTDGVRIEGCQFINSSTVSETAHRTGAIYSHDANYLVRERCLDNPPMYGVCNNEVPNLFRGWHKAIEALETTSGRPILVRKSNFEENMIGVEINGTSFSEIYLNDFSVGNHPFPLYEQNNDDTRNHLGIYVNKTPHYSVEENTVVSPSGATYEGNGVLVFNSKGAENAIYKNTFTNLETGAESDMVNRNTSNQGGVPAGLAGLQFLCNTNSQNEVDFSIIRTDLSDPFEHLDSGTRQDHGSDSPDRPAKNTFSTPNPDPAIYTHFTVDSEFAYKYFYHNNPPSMSEITPSTFAPPYQVNNATCPSNYTTGRNDGIGRNSFLSSNDDFNGLLFTYQETIDEGNTPAMITEIDLAWPQEAWNLRNELMARSPYNSEEVLIAAAEREIMPHAMLLEVLIENPDALRSGSVIRVVSIGLNDPLPEYMIDMLYAVRDETTLRTLMERSLADLNFERERQYKQLVHGKYFLEDGVDEPDSVGYYLGKIKSYEGNLERAAYLAGKDQHLASTSLLDSMLTNYKLKSFQVNELNSLKSLYTLLGQARTQGRSIAQLDSMEVISLKNIAENDNAGLAQAKSRNALCFHFDICYQTPSAPKNNAPVKPKPTKEELVTRLNSSSAFPNPAADYIIFEYKLLHSRENTSIAVFDATGRLVESRILGIGYQGQELFDLNHWSDGMYVYNITQGDNLINTGKFTVIK